MAEPHRILITGNFIAGEMQQVIRDALDLFRDGDVRLMASLSDLSQEAGAAWSPGIVVVCQTCPDAFPAADVHDLLGRFPVARWVCCFGAWCESDGRNRNAWPIGVRVPARLARSRLEKERQVLEGRRSTLPLTAGRDEAFEFDYATTGESPTASHCRGLSVCVLSADRELCRAFLDRLCDFGCLPADSPATADAILFDVDPWSDSVLARVRELRSANSDAGILALTGLETPQDHALLTAAGADAALAKIADGRQLAGAMQQLASRTL